MDTAPRGGCGIGQNVFNCGLKRSLATLAQVRSDYGFHKSKEMNNGLTCSTWLLHPTRIQMDPCKKTIHTTTVQHLYLRMETVLNAVMPQLLHCTSTARENHNGSGLHR